MADIDSIVSIQISQSTTGVALTSFGVPLIIGPTNAGWAATDYIHTYSSPAGMLTDGFTASSPEYVYALAMYGQAITPTQFKVAKRGAAVAEVDTLAVNTLTIGGVYSLSINGQAFSYTAQSGDTQQAILTALSTAIAASSLGLTGAVTGTGSSALLTLTGSTPGQAYTYSAVNSKLTQTSGTPASGIATDLAKALAQDNTWYGVAGCGLVDAEILQAASFVEGNKKLFVAVSGTTAISGASTTDLASQLKAGTYTRTALFYSPANLTSGLEAALVGSELSKTPGSSSFAFKQLSGITADTLTATQVAALIGNPVAGTKGKNANTYNAVGGVNITRMGTAASGQFLDITFGLDWLQSTMQTNVYAALVNVNKIPYTDAGVGILIAAVRAAIDQGVVNGLIDGNTAITVSAPAVLTVSATQRQNRVAPTITFACRLAGAVNAVQVTGTVSV